MRIKIIKIILFILIASFTKQIKAHGGAFGAEKAIGLDLSRLITTQELEIKHWTFLGVNTINRSFTLINSMNTLTPLVENSNKTYFRYINPREANNPNKLRYFGFDYILGYRYRSFMKNINPMGISYGMQIGTGFRYYTQNLSFVLKSENENINNQQIVFKSNSIYVPIYAEYALTYSKFITKNYYFYAELILGFSIGPSLALNGNYYLASDFNPNNQNVIKNYSYDKIINVDELEYEYDKRFKNEFGLGGSLYYLNIKYGFVYTF